MRKKEILVVDDNEDICITIKNYLEAFNYKVYVANSANKGLELINNRINLIILDIMMEGIDGIELCSIIRGRISCPIIFVSAKTLEEDKIIALEVGGDDYITKPFSLKELKARIECHLRREERIKINETYLMTSGNLVLDILAKEALCNRIKLKLTKNEYEIIKFLMLNKNMIFSKEKIFDNVWGIDSESYLETVTESIKNIRKKLKKVDKETSYISTVYGMGYKWEIKNEKE